MQYRLKQRNQNKMRIICRFLINTRRLRSKRKSQIKIRFGYGEIGEISMYSHP